MARKNKKKKKKKHLAHVSYLEGLAQIPVAAKVLIDTPEFIQEQKLWKGFWKHKLVLLFSIVVALFFTSILYHDLHDYFFPSGLDISAELESTKEAGEIGAAWTFANKSLRFTFDENHKINGIKAFQDSLLPAMAHCQNKQGPCNLKKAARKSRKADKNN